MAHTSYLDPQNTHGRPKCKDGEMELMLFLLFPQIFCFRKNQIEASSLLSSAPFSEQIAASFSYFFFAKRFPCAGVPRENNLATLRARVQSFSPPLSHRLSPAAALTLCPPQPKECFSQTFHFPSHRALLGEKRANLLGKPPNQQPAQKSTDYTFFSSFFFYVLFS